MIVKVKKVYDRVLNKGTGQYEWQWVEVPHYRHEKEDKDLAVLEFLKGEMSPSEWVEKHHISSEQIYIPG